MSKKAVVINSIITIALAISTTIVVFCTMVIVYASMLNKYDNKDIYFLGYKPSIVVTGSMAPAIQVNSISIVKKCKLDELKLGDIIMYQNGNGILITHRIIDIVKNSGEPYIVTKGDANKGRDIYPVIEQQIKGKVVYVINQIAPIISEIMPVPGELNTLAAARGVLILVLLVAFISLVVIGISKITLEIIRTLMGESKKFECISNNHKQIIKNNIVIQRRIRHIKLIKEQEVSIIDKVKLGTYNSRIISYIKDIEKTTNKLNNKSLQYSKLHNKIINMEYKKN